jgi:hypothetical protein
MSWVRPTAHPGDAEHRVARAPPSRCSNERDVADLRPIDPRISLHVELRPTETARVETSGSSGRRAAGTRPDATVRRTSAPTSWTSGPSMNGPRRRPIGVLDGSRLALLCLSAPAKET